MSSSTSLNKALKRKILREIHADSTETLNAVKVINPNFHWTEVRYEETGDSILHVAARWGYVETVEKLLCNFSPKHTDVKNNDNKTPLHEAAQFSKYEVCEVLLNNGANVNNLKKSDWTPLMLACTKTGLESLKTIKVLLQFKALVNCSNKDGWTVVHLVCREGDVDILNFLVDNELNIMSLTKNGRTALHIACLHGHLNIVKILLEQNVLIIDIKDNCGNTPIHEAVSGNSLSVLKFLINFVNVNIFERNKFDFTILHLASSVGSTEIVEFIIKVLKLHINETNKFGLSPLHCAAKSKNLDAYKTLLELGVDDSIKDKFGRLSQDYLN